jgi:hypothetical protein
MDTKNLENSDYRTLVTSIRSHTKHMELMLKGYRWTGESDKYEYTGEVMAGSSVINLAVSLVSSFTNESNLLTLKSWQEYSRQLYYTSMAFLRTVIYDASLPAENWRKVFEVFYETLINIGHIITGSKGIIADILVSKEEERTGLSI